MWAEWSSLVDTWSRRTIRLSKASRTMGTQGTPDWTHRSNHRGGGGEHAYIHMHRFIFSVRHLHTYCRYTHGYTDISFPCVCILRVKNTFVFSEWSSEAEAVWSHFIFPAVGRKQWPLWPPDEFRVHFLQFLFICMHMKLNLKKKGMQHLERGERSIKPMSAAIHAHPWTDFQFQVHSNREKVSFAPTVIYSLARNQISCARHEML